LLAQELIGQLLLFLLPVFPCLAVFLLEFILQGLDTGEQFVDVLLHARLLGADDIGADDAR
jgi:hypothetical protein